MHANPQLYQSTGSIAAVTQNNANHADEYFSTFNFWSWIVSAIIESILVSILPLFALENNDSTNGVEGSFIEAGMTCLTCVVIIVNIKMFFIQNKWYYFNYLIIFGSIAIYFASVEFISSILFLDAKFFGVSDCLERF